MARNVGPACRLCRREGIKLMLKGERCYSDRCAIERRPFPPGQHGQRGIKLSDYGAQLREKQKLKWIYGLLERQFRGTFSRAARLKGKTGENLLILLERRLDNMVYRMGFAASRRQARQLVVHGHILVQGRRVDIPSYLVKMGDAVQVGEASRNLPIVQAALESSQRRGLPPWLEVNRDLMQGTVKSLPSRAEIPLPIQEQLIVELYSK